MTMLPPIGLWSPEARVKKESAFPRDEADVVDGRSSIQAVTLSPPFSVLLGLMAA